MRTIAFVTQKGGSGKSTIASSLAVAAHEMKEKVCVIDMDPQGSLANWAKTRGTGDIEVIASGAARLPALLASLERRGFTLAILDTPGAEGAASSPRCRSPTSTSSLRARACSTFGPAPGRARR